MFKLTPAGAGGDTESVLYSFAGGADGASPNAGLLRDSSGALYGTTSLGGMNNVGTNNGGTVFGFVPKRFAVLSTKSPVRGASDG